MVSACGVYLIHGVVFLFVFMDFLPHTNLLTLLCFAAEVMWLFPANRHRYRKSGKQPNNEP